MLRITVIYLLFSLITRFDLNGQHTFSININKYSGLSSSTVYDFYQDSKGFIWIASNAGLTRYDGFEFVTYTSENQTSLAGSAIQEDQYGRIWYQNFDGRLYYVKDELLYSIQQNRPGEYVPYGIVGNYLFVVQHSGVDIFDLKTLKFLKTVEVGVKNIISSTVLKNTFYFTAENKVFKLGTDFKLHSTNHFLQNGLKINLVNNDGENLFLVYRNTNQHTIYFVDENLRFIRENPLNSEGSILTTQFLNDQYWLYTNKGFFVYDKANKLTLSHNDLKLDPSINKCIIDKSKSYWFSSLKSGLYIIPDFNNKIYTFEDLDLMNITRKRDKFLITTLNSRILETDMNFNSPKKIIDLGENNHILNFKYDEENDLLFYTTSGGLHIFHNQKDVYFEDIAVKNILKLDDKYYAITTSGYVILMKSPILKDESKPSAWDYLYNKHRSSKYKNTAILLSNMRAKSLDFYNDKSSFIVTSNVGLYVFDTLEHSEFLIEGKSFYASEIYTYNKKIYLLDNNGNLYVVYRSGRIDSLNDEIGIPVNGIKFIKRFGNMLYIVCPSRVFEYDLTYSTSSTYSFNTNMMSITDLIKTNNQLVLMSGKNIVTIDLNKKSIQKDSQQFYFNSFFVNNEKVSRNTLENLRHNQNTIRISYSLLDYGSSKEPKMSYRLNKGEWIQLTAGAREIQLISLSPGKYELEIRMNNIVLKEYIHFEINFPFYMKWWFFIFVFGVIILTAVFVYSWRVRLMKSKIKQLNEKIILENELRTSMLTSIKAQMNPHFFYNALNTIQSYIFSNDKFNATTYLAKFSKLTRTILEMSGQSTVKLDDEITSLKLYLELEQMRFQSDFSFSITVEESLEIQTIEIPAMLIQPYIENAVKHGLLHKKGEKKVVVSFNDKKELIEVVIDDNGIGRNHSEEINRQKLDKPKSFSTESTKKRLDLLNYDKNIVSVQFEDKYDNQYNSLGTKVTLFISKK